MVSVEITPTTPPVEKKEQTIADPELIAQIEKSRDPDWYYHCYAIVRC